MQNRKNGGQLLVVILAIGFLIGIIYENLVSKDQVFLSELFLKSNLEQYLQMNVIGENYLWYVVKARVVSLILILAFSCFPWKKLFVTITLALCGFFCGMLAVGAVLQLGVKGILLCFAGMFPQGIFYAMSLSVLLLYWFRYPQSSWNRVKLVFVILMFLIGLLLETYVNPIMLRLVIHLL